MGRRGRELALARFNWNNEKAKLLDLYQKILEPTLSRKTVEGELGEKCERTVPKTESV
jgi:hypothetical protein